MEIDTGDTVKVIQPFNVKRGGGTIRISKGCIGRVSSMPHRNLVFVSFESLGVFSVCIDKGAIKKIEATQ